VTTPADIRRRRDESFAFLESAHRMLDLAKADHDLRMQEIQEACPHEHTRSEVYQNGYAITCTDCLRLLESMEE
jgi:hypothetical protein